MRLVDWLVDAVTLAGDAPIDVVLNRAPASADRRRQLVDQLRSITGDRVDDIVSVPTDRRVERAAWDAALVPSGPFRRALADLGLEHLAVVS